MPEENQDVNATESSPVEEQQTEVVNEPGADQQAESTQTETQTTSSQPEGIPSYEAVDEFGVPYKNRTFEWKRKYEDTIEKLPNLIEEAIKSSVQTHIPEKKDPTIADIEEFAQKNPEHRPWAEEKKAEIIRKQVAGEVEQKIKAVETKRESEVKKRQSLEYVSSTYPDVFVKSPQGQIMGINLKSPMVPHIDALMKDPRFFNDPEGLQAAADIAFARVSRMQQGANQMKEQKLKAEVKQLQKQTMIEGGVKQNVQSIPEHKKAIERAKQTGSLRDVQAALAAIAKARRESMEK